MWTARPTAGSTLAFFQLRADSLDMLRPRLRPLDRRRPADPFVASQRRQVVPPFENVRVGTQRSSQISRHSVHGAGRDSFSLHRRISGSFFDDKSFLRELAAPEDCSYHGFLKSRRGKCSRHTARVLAIRFYPSQPTESTRSAALRGLPCLRRTGRMPVLRKNAAQGPLSGRAANSRLRGTSRAARIAIRLTLGLKPTGRKVSLRFRGDD